MPLVAVREPAPEYVPDGFMSKLPADTFPAISRFLPVTESTPVAETLGAKVMSVVVVLRPKVIPFGETWNLSFSNM